MKVLALLAVMFAGGARAQFDLDHAVTDASLRGVSAAGPGIAWASGSGGTILRTEDGGYLWQRCVPPKGGEGLDFRGVVGFDANTALVMASGKGEASRIYKTTDGCSTWRLVLMDQDVDGFFDAMVFLPGEKTGYLLGDPVGGKFVLFATSDGGEHWARSQARGLEAPAGVGGFAASNSALLASRRQDTKVIFGTSGPGGPFMYLDVPARVKVPMAGDSASAGIFSLARDGDVVVAVGGDYAKPDDPNGTAAYSEDGGRTWKAAERGPRGYRSAVAYDAGAKVFLAVGPSGSDVSYDGGRTWRELKDAGGWNAISLPYVVGAKGKIGHLWDGGLKRSQ